MAVPAYRHCLAGRGARPNRVSDGPGAGDLRSRAPPRPDLPGQARVLVVAPEPDRSAEHGRIEPGPAAPNAGQGGPRGARSRPPLAAARTPELRPDNRLGAAPVTGRVQLA